MLRMASSRLVLLVSACHFWNSRLVGLSSRAPCVWFHVKPLRRIPDKENKFDNLLMGRTWARNDKTRKKQENQWQKSDERCGITCAFWLFLSCPYAFCPQVFPPLQKVVTYSKSATLLCLWLFRVQTDSRLMCDRSSLQEPTQTDFGLVTQIPFDLFSLIPPVPCACVFCPWLSDRLLAFSLYLNPLA